MDIRPSLSAYSVHGSVPAILEGLLLTWQHREAVAGNESLTATATTTATTAMVMATATATTTARTTVAATLDPSVNIHQDSTDSVRRSVR